MMNPSESAKAESGADRMSGDAEAGLQIRRRVLGDDYVDAALSNADEFTSVMQKYLNANCWGLAWARSGLEPKLRSALTLAALVAGGKVAEIRGHTRGALRNGMTVAELQEVFLHLAVYLGVPAALEAFRAAQPVVAQWLEEGGELAADG
jgi:4-carboxymuconolactone decarboxylase